MQRAIAARLGSIFTPDLRMKMNDFFYSYQYVVVVANIAFLSNVFGGDLIAFYALTLLAVMSLCVCEDTRPLLPVVSMAYFCVSAQNSPASFSSGEMGFYNDPNVFIQLIVLGSIIFISAIIKLMIMNHRNQIFRRKITLGSGFVMLSAALLVSGVGYGFSIGSFVFSAMTVATWAGIYFLFVYSLDRKKDLIRYFAVMCTIIGLLITFQFAFMVLRLYMSGDLFFAGTTSINRLSYNIGWGLCNNIGGTIIVFLPVTMYLAYCEQHNWAFLVCGLGFLAVTVLSLARTAIIVAVPIFGLSLLVILIKAKHRWGIWIVMVLLMASVAFMLIKYFDQITELLFRLFNEGLIWDENGELADSSRIDIWRIGVDNFWSYKVFGTGFFKNVYGQLQTGGAFNNLYHNTIIQMLASAGIVGIWAYMWHRMQTIYMFFSKISIQRLFLGFALATIVGSSLLDNHIFYPSIGIVYAMLLVMADFDKQETMNIFTVSEKRKVARKKRQQNKQEKNAPMA